jgi:hypothetical protein
MKPAMTSCRLLPALTAVVCGTAALVAVAGLCVASPLEAQQPDTVVVRTDTILQTQSGVELPELDQPMTPGGAMLRAVLLPGWGHASIGSYQRAGFYFAAETTTGFFLARMVRRLQVAKDATTLVEQRATEALNDAGVPEDSVEARLDQDPAVRDKRGLVVSRQQQLEDWIAFGAFLVFISGADAFVSAHLRDFPEPLEPRAGFVPGPAGVTATFGISVPVGPPGR